MYLARLHNKEIIGYSAGENKDARTCIPGVP